MQAWSLDVGCGRQRQLVFIGFDVGSNADVNATGNLETALPTRYGVFRKRTFLSCTVGFEEIRVVPVAKEGRLRKDEKAEEEN